MIRKAKILIIFTIMLLLCSCGAKKEYKVVELTGEELINNLLAQNEKRFIFAFVNKESDNYDVFMKNLTNVSNSTKNNIYYIESDYIDTESALFLYNFDLFDFDNNSYYTFDGKSFDVAEKYVDLSSMYSNLKSFSSKGDIGKISSTQKEEYLKEARQYYEDGQIAMSFDKLNMAWDTEEAKEFYKNSKNYMVLRSWENYEYKLGDKEDKAIYTSWIFYHGVNFYSVATKEGEYNHNFRNDEFYDDDFKDVYYKVIDDVIYTNDTEEGNYKKTYEILDLTEKSMKLKEIKTKKEFVLERYV